MKAVRPSILHAHAQLVTLGAQQPEYDPLPAAISPDGLVVTEWAFTAAELAAILEGGRLILWTQTFGQPFQPVALEIVTDTGEVVRCP